MIIQNQRDKEERLYRAMRDPKSTLMVLSGGPKATLVHAYTQEPDVLDPWQACFLIANLDILLVAEKKEWFDGANLERYIVFGGEDPSQKEDTKAPNKKKRVADQGPVSNLMLSDTEVDKIAVSTAFAKGDQL